MNRSTVRITGLATILAVFIAVVPSFANAQTNDTTLIRKSEAPVTFRHETWEIKADYDSFNASLVKLLGQFNMAGAANVMKNPDLAIANYKSMEGEQQLVLFNVMPHGALLNLAGGAVKAARINVGNPLIALQMMSKDVRAGLYAPLSLFIYEVHPDLLHLEFDLPSTQFGQFGNGYVEDIGRSLDNKLAIVIDKAARLAATQSNAKSQ